LLTIAEAAGLLKVSERHMYDLCYEGHLAYILVGGPSPAKARKQITSGRKRPGAIRIDRMVLENYIARQTYQKQPVRVELSPLVRKAAEDFLGSRRTG